MRFEPAPALVLVVVFLTWLIGYWVGGASPPTEAGTSHLEKLRGDASTYEEVCQAPTDEVQADLCQQWRSAEASTELVFLSRLQIALGVLGSLGLLATVVLSARASAAALDSNEIARSLGEKQMRAYVGWDHGAIELWRADDGTLAGLRVVPTIKNFGQTPALIRLLYSYLWVSDEDFRPSVRFNELEARCNQELGSGNLFDLSAQFISLDVATRVRCGQDRAFLLGYGSYRDVFWQEGLPEHVVRFCFEITFLSEPALAGTQPGAKLLHLQTIDDFDIMATSDGLRG